MDQAMNWKALGGRSDPRRKGYGNNPGYRISYGGFQAMVYPDPVCHWLWRYTIWPTGKPTQRTTRIVRYLGECLREAEQILTC